MKKLMVILMAMMITATATSCGNNEATKTESSQNSQTSQASEESSKETEESKKENESTLLTGTYNIPLHDVYVDTPNYQAISQGYTQIYIVHDVKFATVTREEDVTVTTAKEAYEIAFNKFKINMQNYGGGVNSMNITEDEETTINGIDVYRFEGIMNFGRSQIYDGYAVGYAFQMDGLPVAIIGAVQDPSQSEELKTEIETVIDEMMQSVRTQA